MSGPAGSCGEKRSIVNKPINSRTAVCNIFVYMLNVPKPDRQCVLRIIVLRFCNFFVMLIVDVHLSFATGPGSMSIPSRHH